MDADNMKIRLCVPVHRHERLENSYFGLPTSKLYFLILFHPSAIFNAVETWDSWKPSPVLGYLEPNPQNDS